MFIPRKDQPERFDQQTAFYLSQNPGISWLLGGNGAGTSETALAKVAKFVSTVPAPRPDTPFWIIAGSYEQCMEACWKEKLHGHGHIPDHNIDWQRVSWYRPNNGWPFRVPLRPWAKRHWGTVREVAGKRYKVQPENNWLLEFKSWKQGRQQMQARAIGGFLFVEQFPWGILEEVLRGCREYEFSGNKLCEFTPIDPGLSMPLQEMIEDDDLPPGWAIYRGNTECAMEAGHVSKQWYDEFFGMVPDDMRMVRQIGEFAGFEGVIYNDFKAELHCAKEMDFPIDGIHRRVIDWGSGGNHPFVCLWAYRSTVNGITCWDIYDELYVKDHHTTPEYLKMVDARSKEWGWDNRDPYFGTTWADTAEPGSMLLASKLSENFPECENIGISGANKRILPGIEHVQMALKFNAIAKRPILKIHDRNCPNTKREFRTYRWLQTSEIGLNPRNARREPLDRDNHAMDCVRYLIYSEMLSVKRTISRVSHEHTAGTRGVHLVRP